MAACSPEQQQPAPSPATTPPPGRHRSSWGPLQPHEWTRSMSEAAQHARGRWARTFSQKLGHRRGAAAAAAATALSSSRGGGGGSGGAPDCQTRDADIAAFSADLAATASPSGRAGNTKIGPQELDALEACAWLMEAGFPQYVQLFEERRLPADTAEVAMDHSQLNENLLKPLYRRLQTLAKLSKLNLNLAAAGLKLDCASAGQNDQGALSFKWRVDKKSGKWSHAAATPAALPGSVPPSVHVGEPEAAAGTASATFDASSVTPGSGTSSCDSALGSSAGDSSPRPSRMRAHRGSAAAQAAASAMSTVGGSAALSKSRDSVPSPGSSETESESSSAPSSASSSSSSSPALPTGRRRLRRSDSATRRRDDVTGAAAAAAADATAASAGKQAAMVIGEPVLIRSAETEERLRRLGCLDLADAAARIAGTGATEGSGCAACRGGSATGGASGTAETLYVLPANHVPGTFPMTLELKVVRRNCSGCARKPPSVGDSLMPAAAVSAGRGPPWFGGSGGSDAGSSRGAGGWAANGCKSSAGAAALAKSGGGSGVTACKTAAPASLVRSKSWYDNMPAVGGADGGAADSAPAPAAAAGSMQQLDDIVRELSDFNDMFGAKGADTGQLLPPQLLGSEQPVSSRDEKVATTSALAPDTGMLRPNEGASATTTVDGGSTRPMAPHGGSSSQEDRRDSGVGLSLTREPASSKQSRKRSKKSPLWRGFTSSIEHRYASDVSQLTANQLTCLRKLCLLKVTAQLEEHCPRDVANCILSGTLLRPGQKSTQQPEPYEGESGLVFSVPLYVIQQIEGHPLPVSIQQVMASLRQVAHETIGIFRRPGVKSRIQKLRSDIDAGNDVSLVDGVQAYDLADLLKQFFRELPECLFTDKLSEVFLAIHQYVPLSERAEVMRAAMILLPCENRQALRALLEFMAFVAGHSSTNQMTASNLAVCFAPSLFSLGSLAVGSLAGCGGHPASGRSPKVPRKNSGPSTDHISDLLDQKYAHECLKQMLDQGDQLFKIPDEFAAYTFTCRDEMLPSQLTELLKDSGGSHRIHVDECIRGVLKEFRGKSKGWTADRLPAYVGKGSLTVTVSHKSTWRDGGPLPLWKASVEVEAPPVEVLTRLVQERNLWDDCKEVRCCRKALDGDTELVHFTSRPDARLPNGSSGAEASNAYETEHIVLRSWRAQLQQDPGMCVLISHSVDPAACTSSQHPQQSSGPGSTSAAITYASHYLVEPCGAGKSRVTHISCVDLLGHLPGWYERHYACRAARSLARLRDSFRRQHACMADAGVPETSL